MIKHTISRHQLKAEHKTETQNQPTVARVMKFIRGKGMEKRNSMSKAL